MGIEERYHKTFTISWEMLQIDCKTLSARLLGKRPWEKIVGIARGGLTPAAIVARELDIHLVDTVCISSYTVKTQGAASILKALEVGENSENWLIIDDLVDTGKTAQIIRKMLPYSYFATVYAKPEGRVWVDDCITQVSQDTWILFPWDSAPAYVKPLAEM
jgi:xanthine phosphoribosyltransferase